MVSGDTVSHSRRLASSDWHAENSASRCRQLVLISSLWGLVETDCMQEERVSQFFLFWTCKRLRYSRPSTCHEGMQVDWTLAPLSLTLVLDGCQWLASHPGCFTPGTFWRGGLLGLKASLDAVEKRKISSASESDPMLLSPNPGSVPTELSQLLSCKCSDYLCSSLPTSCLKMYTLQQAVDEMCRHLFQLPHKLVLWNSSPGIWSLQGKRAVSLGEYLLTFHMFVVPFVLAM
jgi:hypothetical protein